MLIRRQVVFSFFAVVVAVTTVYSFLATPYTRASRSSSSPGRPIRHDLRRERDAQSSSDPAEYSSTLRSSCSARPSPTSCPQYELDKRRISPRRRKRPPAGCSPRSGRPWVVCSLRAKRRRKERSYADKEELDPGSPRSAGELSADFGRSGSILEIKSIPKSGHSRASLRTARPGIHRIQSELRVNPFRLRAW